MHIEKEIEFLSGPAGYKDLPLFDDGYSPFIIVPHSAITEAGVRKIIYGKYNRLNGNKFVYDKDVDEVMYKGFKQTNDYLNGQ
jgi:hypothetical protein